MKKKVISLLLVVAMLVSVFSVALGTFTITASAAKAGGVENINCFRFTPQTTGNTGASITTTVSIKSSNSNYRIRVNSLSAYLPKISSYATVSGASGVASSTSSVTVTITKSMSAGQASVVRYECNYDLLDNNGNVVYAGMTGLGYGYFSYGSSSGACGEDVYIDRGDSGHSIWGTLFNTCYVNAPAGTTTFRGKCEAGYGEHNRVPTITGSKPSTLTINNFRTPDAGSTDDKTSTYNFFEMGSYPGSGYWYFGLQEGTYLPTTTYCEMYNLADTDKNNCLTKANTYLNYGLEKSYYTAATWNNYVSALDNLYNVAYCVPYAATNFKSICQTANGLSGGSALTTAYNALAQAQADYSAFNTAKTNFNNAVSNFNTAKATTVSAVTYNASGATGTTSVNRYSSSAISSVQSNINSYTSIINGYNTGLYRVSQPTVNNYVSSINTYTSNIRTQTNNMALNGAYYTGLNAAISDYNNYAATYNQYSGGAYTAASWSNYTNAVNSAKSCATSYDVSNQSTIDTHVRNITTYRQALVYNNADYSSLTQMISHADVIYNEYNSGLLLTTAEGFDTAKANFDAAYNNAKAALTYDVTHQGDVDAAEENLSNQIGVMTAYRRLDTMPLEQALNKVPKYMPEDTTKWASTYSKYYERTSWQTFMSLRNEAARFLIYALNGMKTMEDVEEMNNLVYLLNEAFDNLALLKANFDNLNAALEQVPSIDVINLYKDEVAEPLRQLIAQVDFSKTFEDQEAVDKLADDLLDAAAKLTDDMYKDADYSGVYAALTKASELNPANYVDFSGVTKAINSVDYTLLSPQQNVVDGYETAIIAAIDALVPISASYTSVNNAIAQANSIEHPEYYANYSGVTAAINAVDWNKNIFQQAEVEAMAQAILEAIDVLTLAPADYTCVSNAIDHESVLGNMDDYTDESLNNLDSVVNSVEMGLTADKQDIVNGFAQAILDAIDAMVLKPANFEELDKAVSSANSIARYNYNDLSELDAALAMVDRTKNCREQADVDAVTQAIITALGNLTLKSADYTYVNNAIKAAQDKIEYSEYEYTQASIDYLQGVIDSIDWELNILYQADVDAYVESINAAAKALEYVVADYSGVDAAIERANALVRTDYVDMTAVDSAILGVETGLQVDRQAEVDAMAQAINDAIDSLEFAPADYTAVNRALESYDALIREYYEISDLAVVDEIVYNEVVMGLLKNQQEAVNDMATKLANAIRDLEDKMKDADLTALESAVSAANAKILEMSQTGNELDPTLLGTLYTYTNDAMLYYGTKINVQDEIDELTANIIDATANLDYAFKIMTDESEAIFEGNFIYGFYEGITPDEILDMITFIGVATVKVTPSDRGYGTGSVVTFFDANGEEIESYNVVIFGDADGDGWIDSFDVIFAMELSNYEIEGSDIIEKAVDLTGDGFVDTYDVSILISLANMEYELAQDGSFSVR